MRNKMIYHIIKLLKGKRSALDYAIHMQIKEVKNRNEKNWWYWHKKIIPNEFKGENDTK
tara:strand:- start:10 stop:186 length:177 start_codon:yes stop_codon:yes gene_type:complete